MTCCGHLDQDFNIFAYLKHHLNYKLVMGTNRMYFGQQFKSRFKSNTKWFELYGGVKDKFPINDPPTYVK